MSHSFPFRSGFLIGCCLALYLPLGALAQDAADADAREVSAYVLTEAGLAKFRQAQQNLARLGDGLSPNCEDDGEEGQSLDGMVAGIRAVPGAANAIEAAGLPIREYAVFVFSLVQTGLASWALDQPGGALPPEVSMANVEFYRNHEAELLEATAMTSSDRCGEEEYDDYEESEDESYDEAGYQD